MQLDIIWEVLDYELNIKHDWAWHSDGIMIAAPSIWALVWNVISWVMWIQLIIWRSALLDRTPDSFALSNRNLWDFIGPWDVLMLKPSFSSSRAEKSKKGKSASFLLRAFLSPKNQVDHTESRESFQLEKRTNYTQRQTDRETFHCVTSGELITWTKDQVLRKKEVLLTLSYQYQNLLI